MNPVQTNGIGARGSRIEPGSPSLEIRLFGPMTVRCDGRALPKMPTRKEQWLLALLALHSATALDRAYLAGVLWPDADEGLSRQYLRRSLVQVRKALGSEAYRIHSPTPKTLGIDLSGDAVCDVLIFDRARLRTDEASLAEAATVYRGPLLQGCVEDWALAEQESRQRAVVVVLQTLAERLRARGELTAAVAQLRRALEVDPLCETAARALMTVLADEGQHAAAAETFHAFRTRLHRDMNAAPDPETIRLSRQLSEEARAEGAPARTLVERRPGFLPAAIAPLIGRAAECSKIAELLRTHRLVTLTGPGGVGKTRLATAVAESVRGDFPDGTWFVDLSSLHDPSLIAMVVLAALGGTESADRNFTDTLTDHLQARQLLLLLDNCEHLTEECCRMTQMLLRSCPGLRVIATSREPLHAPAEAVWPVPGLATADAARLFTDRAIQARPSFTLTGGNAEAVDRICARLDRMPLAIEIVAARARGMSAARIAGDLDDVFRFLHQSGGHLDPRHQTLGATLDWSYGLLRETERWLLSRLSIFAGGWTLEAAMAICEGEGIAGNSVPDLLLSLVDKSLVLYGESAAGEGRYRLLETTRAYAATRLTALERRTLQTELARFLLNTAEKAKAHWGGMEERAWLDRLEVELPNIRVALSQPVPDAEGEQTSLRLSTALLRLWWRRGHVVEGRRFLNTMLDHCDPSERTETRAAALNARGVLAHFQRDAASALADHEAALSIRRDLGDRRGMAVSLHNMSIILQNLGDLSNAINALKQCVALYRDLGDEARAIAKQHQVDDLAALTGSAEEADVTGIVRRLEDSMRRRAVLEEAQLCADLAVHLLKTGQYGDALTYVRRAIAIRREEGEKSRIAEALEMMAVVREGLGRHADLPLFYGAAARLREEIGCPIIEWNRIPYEQNIAQGRAVMGAVEFEAAWAVGHAMLLDEAVDLALQVESDR